MPPRTVSRWVARFGSPRAIFILYLGCDLGCDPRSHPRFSSSLESPQISKKDGPFPFGASAVQDCAISLRITSTPAAKKRCRDSRRSRHSWPPLRPAVTPGPWRCLTAVAEPLAWSCRSSFVDLHGSGRLQVAFRGGAEHHRSNTKSRLLSMVRCTHFARIGAECVGSRSELGEALVAAETLLWVHDVCSLTPFPRQS